MGNNACSRAARSGNVAFWTISDYFCNVPPLIASTITKLAAVCVLLIHSILTWKRTPQDLFIRVLACQCLVLERHDNAELCARVCVFLPDPVDFLHLPGIGCYPPSAFHDQQNRGSWDHHDSLPFLLGPVPCLVPDQLDLALLLWGFLWPHSCCCWCGADYSVLRFLLFVCYERWDTR